MRSNNMLFFIFSKHPFLFVIFRIGENSIKWIGDLTNAVLVDSFLQNFSYAFAYASGSIAYLAELMHLLGKSHVNKGSKRKGEYDG